MSQGLSTASQHDEENVVDDSEYIQFGGFSVTSRRLQGIARRLLMQNPLVGDISAHSFWLFPDTATPWDLLM